MAVPRPRAQATGCKSTDRKVTGKTTLKESAANSDSGPAGLVTDEGADDVLYLEVPGGRIAYELMVQGPLIQSGEAPWHLAMGLDDHREHRPVARLSRRGSACRHRGAARLASRDHRPAGTLVRAHTVDVAPDAIRPATATRVDLLGGPDARTRSGRHVRENAFCLALDRIHLELEL
jgi:hypothetical protein